MEALFVLLGVVLLATPVAVVVLVIAHLRLRRALRDMQARLASLEGWDAAAATPDPAPVSAATPDSAPAAAEPVAPKPPMPQANAAPAAAKAPTGAVVLRADRLDALGRWLRENWFYAAAALSLALAGIFLVQYGVETGLLTPPARVAAALGFGALLIAGGEVIRRRGGDGPDSATAYLPSVLSGAGLVSLMGGVLAARLLYDLVAPGPALAALFAIALAGLVLGWRHGPLLAAIGLGGGMAAPFLVGGQTDRPEWLLLYFALLTALGLGIDTLRRWAWISALALVLGFAAGWLLVLGGADSALRAGFAVYAAALVLMATLIPARALTPDHAEPMVSEALLRHETVGWPIFPLRLSMAALLGACLPLLYAAAQAPVTWWIALALAAGLAALFALWSERAPGLQDHALPPALVLLALIAAPELNRPVLEALRDGLAALEGQTETRLPREITLVLLAALVPALAAFRRALQPGRFGLFWAGAATLLAPLAGLALELSWQPAALIGAWPWALHALALAALLSGMAGRIARADGTDRTRAALAAVAALASLAFALTVILTEAALTLALAATVVAAAALDRRFDLPLMTGYIAAGIVALGVRLVADPGLGWATSAPVLEMLAAYGGTLAALLAALWLIGPRPRPRARIFLESAAWSVGGMTLSLILYHVIEAFTGHAPGMAHWVLGLHGAIWAALALAQLERLRLGGWLIWLRAGLAALFGLIALITLGLAASLGNPLLAAQEITGPLMLNTLAPAYLLPGLVIGLGALRLSTLPRALRIALAAVAGLLVVGWAGLALRHGWRGSEAMLYTSGTTQPELYSYTVALLLAGAGLFWQALARRSAPLRRAGVLVIGLAVAKVFLVDIAGLAGLVRVFSFLLLGLSLAGLAWLNRWAQGAGPEADPASRDPV
ncbi:DUF2339 domain-containing protein [Pseudoponticoccus marisrubri]|uniref:DUF2339 domain-containing protein n=1 Tax=Pseudoponticoccus marisrubri TaxID=1685382 RepID=A0A0W7WNR7_9RHOB|nr:DUF2339 domain-containing protein [Pseudoponticoccus marisrubri]KUF12202.1 hypothetical protein AVJ23_00245 [Pseudoponticoccus marisrubri]